MGPCKVFDKLLAGLLEIIMLFKWGFIRTIYSTIPNIYMQVYKIYGYNVSDIYIYFI